MDQAGVDQGTLDGLSCSSFTGTWCRYRRRQSLSDGPPRVSQAGCAGTGGPGGVLNDEILGIHSVLYPRKHLEGTARRIIRFTSRSLMDLRLKTAGRSRYVRLHVDVTHDVFGYQILMRLQLCRRSLNECSARNMQAIHFVGQYIQRPILNSVVTSRPRILNRPRYLTTT